MKSEIIRFFGAVVLGSVMALTWSCREELRVYEADAIGAMQSDYEVPAVAGYQEVKFYANRKGTISFLSGEDWASVDKTTFESSGSFNVDFLDNDEYPRMAEILLSLDDYPWRDTVRIKQHGKLSSEYSLPSTNITMSGTAVSAQEIVAEIEVDTELRDEAFRFQVVYTSEQQDWVSEVKAQDGKIVIVAQPNADELKVRTATVVISCDSGWGEIISQDLFITQANAKDEYGEKITIPVLKTLASEDGEEIIDDIFIEGHIVGDVSSLNLAENPQTTSTTIDYTACRKAAYIQALDGSAGVMIETDTEGDNIFKDNSYVQIRLKGTKAYRYSEPDRLVLEGVKSTMVLKNDRVEKSAVAEKRKKIGELTDDDVYTRVILTDVELPVRKGGLTPVNEGYTRYSKSHRVSKFPVLVRCVDGESMYMYTNMTCPYRRDGRRHGDGSGTIEGIIVHELYRSFEDGDSIFDELCGNIGRYQIRHTAFEDIRLEASIDNSFSGLIAEWRYMTTADADGYMPASAGNGRMTHTCPTKVYSNGLTMYKAVNDWSYLGPCAPTYGDQATVLKEANQSGRTYTTSDLVGNLNGLGIILPDGTDYSAGDQKMNEDGKGGGQGRGYGWAADYWWDNKADKPYGWVTEFSTKDIATDVLSTQISMLNLSQSALTPIDWVMEYSLTGADTDWHSWEGSEFSVPDLVLNAVTLPSQCAGYKGMDFRLPEALKDQEKVFLKVRPRSKRASSTTEFGTDLWVYKDGRRCAMNYWAVRYNKNTGN